MDLTFNGVVLALSMFWVGHAQGMEPHCDASMASENEQGQQACFNDPASYCHHILAVDADGNALMPWVTRTLATDGSNAYQARTTKLCGEDTRGAKIDAATLAAIIEGRDKAPAGPALRNVLAGRRQLYLYLDAMFRAIEQERPDEVVVHIHGGLNDINGAIAKTVLISDDLERRPPTDRRIFYIGICWNSDLFPTYTDHLLSIREGLHQPGKALVTAPAMLLSDLGGAASRLPLNLIDFLYQDAYTVNPTGFKRTRLAETRYDQLRERQELRGTANSLVVSSASNDRSAVAREGDAGLWLLTQPAKIATTFFLDWLGSEPWKNMLRRTRTMFERESEFIPEVDYPRNDTAGGQPGWSAAQKERVDAFLDQMNFTGREGAVSFFCNQAQSRLLGASKRPVITLIGHSMGAIVSCEILERFHQLTLDNVVFMGAACSINDLKSKVIPYLQEQNLRETMQTGLTADLENRLTAELRAAGSADAVLAEVRTACERLGGKTPQPKTRFFNLCLHDTAENGEKNPSETDLVQRGSLLTWIDVLYQKPESENDRTLGRWVNAILATDSFPADVVNRITIKEFGVERPLAPQLERLQDYAFQPDGKEKYVQEPMHHGDFARFEPGLRKEATNLAYWREIYRLSELEPAGAAPSRTAARKGTNQGTSAQKKVAVVPSRSPAPSLPELPAESGSARNARTGF
jgi:hypothetical protein